MENKQNMHSLMEGYFDAIESNEFPSRQKLFEEWGLDKVFAVSWYVRRAVLRLPNPIPVNDLGMRMDYYPNDFVRTRLLDPLVELGILTSDYFASDKAKEFFSQYHAVLNQDMMDLETLSDQDLQRLLDLIGKGIDYISSLDEPFHPEIDLYNRRKPDPKENLNKKIQYGMFIFYIYRDDAHVATWVPSGLRGQEWDALTFLWNGEANSPESLAEKLTEDKGYDEQGYAAALQKLAEKGLAEEIGEANIWQVTEAGKTLRDDAEAQTDVNYNKIFDAFDEAEREEFVGLLTTLTDKLQKEDAKN